MLRAELRAAPRSKSSWGTRANHVFGADEKRILTKNMVMDKSNDEQGLLLYKIAD